MSSVELALACNWRRWPFFVHGCRLDYLVATGLAVEIAVIHNFLWHERFTWADRPAARRVQSLVRLAKFNASNGAVSIAGNLVLMRLLVGELKFNYVASNLVAIVVVFAGEFPAWRSLRVRRRGEPGRDLVLAAGRASLGWTAEGGRPYVVGDRWFWTRFLGVTPRSNPGYNAVAAMRSNGYISPLQTCWIEGRACPRRYLSVLPSHVRANLFGSD